MRKVFQWFNIQKNIINNKESVLRKFVPPIIMEKILRLDTSFFKEKPAIHFIVGFILLFFFQSMLIILKHKWLARQCSKLSYLLLVIAIGIELYQQIKQHND